MAFDRSGVFGHRDQAHVGQNEWSSLLDGQVEPLQSVDRAELRQDGGIAAHRSTPECACGGLGHKQQGQRRRVDDLLIERPIDGNRRRGAVRLAIDDQHHSSRKNSIITLRGRRDEQRPWGKFDAGDGTED